MNFKNLSQLALVGALGATFIACGGSDVPKADRVRADFQSPSGSVKDKSQLAEASISQGASSDLGALAGGLNIGLGLSSQKQTGLARLEFSKQYGGVLRQLQDVLQGRSSRALSARDYSACTDGDQISSAMQNSLSSAGTSGSFDFSIDLATCSSGELTGRMAVSGEFDVDAGAQKFTFTLTQKFTAVCETSGDKKCVDGEFLTEATFANDTIEMVAGWSATATWTEDGKARKIDSKGGLKLSGLGDDSRSSIEYLVYVTLDDGTEVSFVLSIQSSESGTVIAYRGTDGSTQCTISADGSGSCDGGLTWDEAFADAIEDAESLDD